MNIHQCTNPVGQDATGPWSKDISPETPDQSRHIGGEINGFCACHNSSLVLTDNDDEIISFERREAAGN